MNGEHLALISLAATLLGTIIVTTWRSSAVTTKLLAAVSRLEQKEQEQDIRIKRLDEIPTIQNELSHIAKNYSMIPRFENRLTAIETELKVRRRQRSNPGIDDD